MVRLDPMTEADFREYLERAALRRAERGVQRGIWSEEAAQEESRRDLAQWLPQGLQTPHHHFAHIVDERTGARVGETTYTMELKGGKTQFWIDWLWVAPEHRRRGLGTDALNLLARQAAQAGADRVHLKVFVDNPSAKALYLKLGFVETATDMAKRVDPVPNSDD